MSMRYQAAVMSATYVPLLTPNAPTIGTAAASNAQATVTFTAPTNVGGSAITSYVVVSSGGQFASGTSSPITVTGLTNGTAYTFQVYAVNTYGPGAWSAASNSVTPINAGQQVYAVAGTYSWVAPASVTSVSAVVVGGGGGGGNSGGDGGGGGGLAYKNNYPVTPGNSYTVVVGAGAAGGAAGAGGPSYFVSSGTVNANPGSGRTPGSGTAGDAIYSGGAGGVGSANRGGGGGGAAGYAGNGGVGGNGGTGNPGATGSGGAGGGGGGGGYSGPMFDGYNWYYGGSGGGGVGLLGQGVNGAGGAGATYSSSGYSTGGAGGGGSGGNTGIPPQNVGYNPLGAYDPAAAYGAGGGSGGAIPGASYGVFYGQGGGVGAVRIIWPGTTRQFPSTNTGDM